MNIEENSIDTKPLVEGYIVKKAYEIDLDKLDGGYLSDSIICYAENVNKAKIELLKLIKYDNWIHRYSGEELSYLNIPVKRRKSADKVIFDGKEVVRYSIDELIEQRERIKKLDEILNDPNIKYCYIIKGDYYRPNSRGYTSSRFEAGVYPKKEAVNHAKSVRGIRLECVDINEHNEMINQKIVELKERLL